MRLIDADALALKLRYMGYMDEHEEVQEVIDEAPTVEERKKGKWIDYTEDDYVECPFCHSATNCDGNKIELHFCFSCGADMRGERKEDDER